MLKPSQDAIRELRQAHPLIKRLRQRFYQGSYIDADFMQLERAYDRVIELTSKAEVQVWVSPPFSAYDGATREVSLTQVEAHEISARLDLYVEGILKSAESEEMLNRLAQENASLKDQLAELSQREPTYLSLIREAQTAASYEVPPESAQFLLHSLQRERETLAKNIRWLEETKAKYGLDPPLHILNSIDENQERLRKVETSIANLEAGKTDKWI